MTARLIRSSLKIKQEYVRISQKLFGVVNPFETLLIRIAVKTYRKQCMNVNLRFLYKILITRVGYQIVCDRVLTDLPESIVF